MVEGPIEIHTADGRTIRCDRFAVALCLCHRSKTYPLCDTSHRKHTRAPDTV
nr:CDGSH iron-sulfur domain-containing protein [Nocardia bovistercoris]